MSVIPEKDRATIPSFHPMANLFRLFAIMGWRWFPLRESGTPTVTVAGAPNPTILNGEVDWVYAGGTRHQEQLFLVSRFEEPGVSADDRRERSRVSDYRLDSGARVQLRQQRYPQPGDPNPGCRVGVVSTKGGKVSWVHVPVEQGQDYIPRFGWVDRKTLWVETLSRDQKHRRIYFAEPGYGYGAQRS